MFENTALLIIDLQLGSFSENKPVHNGNELLNNIQHLITRSRTLKIPILFTQHNGKAGTLTQKGTIGWEIHTSLSVLYEDIIIKKNYPDSFQLTDLHLELEKKNINQIIVTGIQSEICVDATCRSAFSKGYKVILVEDANSTFDTDCLTAPQIIKHHNNLQAQWFSTLKKTKEILVNLSPTNHE